MECVCSPVIQNREKPTTVAKDKMTRIWLKLKRNPLGFGELEGSPGITMDGFLWNPRSQEASVWCGASSHEGKGLDESPTNRRRKAASLFTLPPEMSNIAGHQRGNWDVGQDHWTGSGSWWYAGHLGFWSLTEMTGVVVKPRASESTGLTGDCQIAAEPHWRVVVSTEVSPAVFAVRNWHRFQSVENILELGLQLLYLLSQESQSSSSSGQGSTHHGSKEFRQACRSNAGSWEVLRYYICRSGKIIDLFPQCNQFYLGVSKNRGTPKSWILIRFSTINHPFWGTPIFGNIHLSC